MRKKQKELLIALDKMGTSPDTMRLMYQFTEMSSDAELAELKRNIKREGNVRSGLVLTIEGKKRLDTIKSREKLRLSSGQDALINAAAEAPWDPEHLVDLMKSSRGLTDNELHSRAKLVREHGITGAYRKLHPHRK